MPILRNGIIVTPEEEIAGFEVVIREGRIESIRPASTNGARPTNEIIDLDGAYLIPGIIDIHSDYIEHMAAPRPVAILDFTMALREAERELITHGITTTFHSLSMYDFTEFATNPLRTPDNTRKLIDLIRVFHDSEHIIHHRFHARFEIDNLKRVAELEEYLEEGRVHLISFMDHTPGQGQYRNLEIYRKTLAGYRNLSNDEVDRIITHSRSREKLATETIARLARLAADRNISVASHDDDSIEKVELVSSWGASISEFPITLEVARRARSLGMHTVAGAPNVLLGGSHSGNLSATEAILDGAVDILCSDYYPASMLHAVFALHRTHGVALASAVRLVTCNPARAVGIDGETGSIEAGKRADLLAVRVLSDGSPVVTTAFVNGERVFSSAYRR